MVVLASVDHNSDGLGTASLSSYGGEFIMSAEERLLGSSMGVLSGAMRMLSSFVLWPTWALMTAVRAPELEVSSFKTPCKFTVDMVGPLRFPRN